MSLNRIQLLLNLIIYTCAFVGSLMSNGRSPRLVKIKIFFKGSTLPWNYAYKPLLTWAHRNIAWSIKKQCFFWSVSLISSPHKQVPDNLKVYEMLSSHKDLIRLHSKSPWKRFSQRPWPSCNACRLFSSYGKAPLISLFILFTDGGADFSPADSVLKRRNSITAMKFYVLWAIGYSWPNQASALQWCQHPLL